MTVGVACFVLPSATLVMVGVDALVTCEPGAAIAVIHEHMLHNMKTVKSPIPH